MDGSMGVLTNHGYDAAHLMGKFQGQKYAGAGLPLDACSDMFVYCEEVSASLTRTWSPAIHYCSTCTLRSSNKHSSCRIFQQVLSLLCECSLSGGDRRGWCRCWTERVKGGGGTCAQSRLE